MTRKGAIATTWRSVLVAPGAAPNQASESTSTAATTPPAASQRPRRAGWCRTATVAVPSAGVPTASSAASTSSALCGRSAGRFCRQPHDQAGEPGRQARPPLLDRHRRLGRVSRDQVLRRAPGEGRLPGEHLVADHAERVEIRAVIGGEVGHGLLGRHVDRRPEGEARRGERPATALRLRAPWRSRSRRPGPRPPRAGRSPA